MLTTAQGAELKGYYGKVTCWDDATQRFAVELEGKAVAIKRETSSGLGAGGFLPSGHALGR